MLSDLLRVALVGRSGASAGNRIGEFLRGGVSITVGGLPVTITASEFSNYVDLSVRPIIHPVKLSLEVGRSTKVVDITGNKPGLETHQKGYGRLLVNIGILVLREFYQSDDAHVFGTVTHRGSDSGTPNDIVRRARFWMDAGFVLDNPKVSPTNMKGRLGDLVVREKIPAF